jgi:hypothetical protein
MQPCPNCGRMEVDAAGYCQNCGAYRGTQGYDTAPPASSPPYGAPYGSQASAPPYGDPSSGAPYGGGPSSGPPYSGAPYSGAPYSGPPYQAQPQQPYGGYTDPNYQQQSFAPAPTTGRRPSTIPLILLSVVAVILVVGIVTVVVVRSGSDSGGTDNPGNGATAAPADTVAAGLDKCVVGNWRVTSAREKVEIEGQLYEFTASGGTIEFRGDGTATIDYGSGVVYRTTMSGQSVTITVTGSAKFSYKTVDNTITYSNMSESGELVYRVNDTVTDTIPLDLDTAPNGYTCSGSSLTLTTDLTTTELRK